MMAATFGYLLPTREMVMSKGMPDIGRFFALAERAEELGFDSIWVGDSVLARPRRRVRLLAARFHQRWGTYGGD